jgi:superfamily II DNA or RNA helicase
MTAIADFREIDAITPGDFELFVRDVFAAAGWTDLVVTRPGDEYRHGDGGVDIFGRKANKSFAIEVKQRSDGSLVDVKALNQLVTGARLAGVSNMILVTNSYFTSEVGFRALRLGVELIDRDRLQSLWIERHSEIGRRIKPRVYQQAIIDQVLEGVSAAQSRFLIEMATGLGKTYTAAHIVKKLIARRGPKTTRVLFVAHQVELLQQAATSFKNVLGIGTYSYSACFDGADPEATDLVFASFDTLFAKIDKLSRHTFDVVIIDEAHHTPARTFARVAEHFQPAVLLGLSATPYRRDNEDVLKFFGGANGHIGKYDLAWAIRHNWLAAPQYFVMLSDLDQSRLDTLQAGMTLADLDRQLFLHQRDAEIIRIIEATIHDKGLENPKGIVFCKNVRHINHLIQFFPPGSATLVHSKMKAAQRRANIREFREGGYRFILVCDLFNEGVDIPETNLLVFLRRTSSRVRWLQQLGRGLRKTRNKDYVYVLDFVSSLQNIQQIESFFDSVQATPLDSRESEGAAKDALHDSALRVHYSQSAAQILKLINDLEYRLKSRSEALEALRRYRRENGRVPPIETLEKDLPDISYDQVATHFNSYFGYMTAAFGGDFETTQIRASCLEYRDAYRQTSGCNPSARAISLAGRCQSLPLCTETEVRSLLTADASSADRCCVSPSAECAKPIPPQIVSSAKESNTVDVAPDPIFLRHLGSVRSIDDLQQLPPEELSRVRSKYRSLYRYLRHLREARANANATPGQVD